ncbi:MAG: hypothetical protein H6570_16630 [Lewinellaceae bacterium]|nr:hypothetical protein [Lewinellaceae bacterium]
MAQKKKSTTSTPKPVKKVRSKKSIPAPAAFHWKQHWIPALILVVLPLALYWQSVNYDFVLDDSIVYSENNFVKKGISGIGEILTTETFSGYFGEQKNLVVGARYRPLSLVTFAIENQLFGTNPKTAHIINILLYVLSVILLYRLFFLLTGASASRTWFWSLPFVAALWWVVHPVHVEVVANIKGRDEIMALLLAGGAMWYGMRYFDKGGWWRLGVMSIALLGGILAKENAFTFLGLIPMAWWVFREWRFDRKGWMLLGSMAVIGLVYFAMRYHAIGYIQGVDPNTLSIMNNPFRGMNLGERMGTIAYTMLDYVRLLIFPHPLTHDYYPYHIPITNFGNWQPWLAMLIYLPAIYFAITGVLRKNTGAYGIAFYLATLLVISNIIFPVGTFMNERFLYMPSFGIALTLGWLVTERIPVKYYRLAQGLLVITVIGFLVRTYTRVPVWENKVTLNRAAMAVSTNSARANLFYGTIYFDKSLQAANNEERNINLDTAEVHIRRAIEILPSYGDAIRMLGGVAAERYKTDGDLNRLLDQFYQVLMMYPRDDYIPQYMEYLNNRRQQIELLTDFDYRVGTEIMMKKFQYYPEAIKYLNYGLTLNPDDRRLNQAMADSYRALGQPENATPYLQRALQ